MASSCRSTRTRPSSRSWGPPTAATGVNTFALPNLQARVPLHLGAGFNLGASGGEAAVALTTAQIPAHTHVPVGSSNAASVGDPSNAYWATTTNPAYSPSAGVTMAQQAISTLNGNIGHQNMSPYLTLSFCIALQGIFPSRN